MAGQRIAYARVSSTDQNADRQLAGLIVDQVFIDKASGKDTVRPELERLLAYIRSGDTLIVHSMDRLARNLDDLRQLVNTLTEKGIKIEFIKENLIFSGDDSPMAILLMSVMGAFGEFERSLIKERQREGIALAKKRGVYKGRKKALSSQQEMQLIERVNRGESKAEIARDLGITRETLYQYLKRSSKAKHTSIQ